MLPDSYDLGFLALFKLRIHYLLIVEVPRLGDSEGTFSVFESSFRWSPDLLGMQKFGFAQMESQ